MKNLLLILLGALLFVSCSKDDNEPSPTLSVAPVAVSFTAQATESHDVVVTTNQSSWDAVSNQNWCTVTKGNGKFTVKATANTSTSSPTPAVITVTAGTAKPVTINVTQSGVGAELSVNIDTGTPVSFTNVGGESETKTITVTSNQSSWNVVSNQTWCTVNKNGDIFTIAVSANTETEERNAIVTVSAGNAANVTIEVTQAGVGAQLSISPETPITFTYAGGANEAKTIAVSTNQSSWNAVSNQNWCTVKKSGNQFTVTASAYTGTKPRNATITVSAGSATNVTIEVTQTGVYTEDQNLEKAVHTLGYAANLADLYNDRKQKPSYILLPGTVNEVAISADYFPNGALDRGVLFVPGGKGNVHSAVYYDSDMGRRPAIIIRYSMNSTREASIKARADIKSGSYDYTNDPEEVIAYFGDWMGSSVFTSLNNLKLITNNNEITEKVYNSISFSTNCYKMIVFGKNNAGKLTGKYVGYSTNGKTYIYWCIDPESSSFGEKASANTPYN